MKAGFVYVFYNPAMPGLVKIGMTGKSPSRRAKDLHTTGVPNAFILVYDEFVTDRLLVEKKVHKRFEEYRLSGDREFFRVTLREAIRGLMEEAAPYLVPQVGAKNGVEILPDLKSKYSKHLQPDILSMKIVHREDVVFLEVTKKPVSTYRDEVIERSDLSFIGDPEPMFLLERSPEENARLFVHQLDEVSLVMCFDIFTPAACEEITLRFYGVHAQYPDFGLMAPAS